MALAAIADDGDLLGLDEIEVGIPIVIDAHGSLFGLFGSNCCRPAALEVTPDRRL
jgi:hypothetical protein